MNVSKTVSPLLGNAQKLSRERFARAGAMHPQTYYLGLRDTAANARYSSQIAAGSKASYSTIFGPYTIDCSYSGHRFLGFSLRCLMLLG